MTKRTCPRCGGPKDFYAICCRGCKRPEEWPNTLKGRRGADHPAYKGGAQVIDKDGYLRVYAPDHPWPRKGGMIGEHIRLMELHIGRRIKLTECVHHKDLDHTNNVIPNLQLMTKSEHSRLHRGLDAHLRQRDEMGRFAREASA